LGPDPRCTSEGERDRYQRWWLDHFTLDEIREMGVAMFGR
jgi:hypothetical protein